MYYQFWGFNGIAILQVWALSFLWMAEVKLVLVYLYDCGLYRSPTCEVKSKLGPIAAPVSTIVHTNHTNFNSTIHEIGNWRNLQNCNTARHWKLIILILRLDILWTYFRIVYRVQVGVSGTSYWFKFNVYLCSLEYSTIQNWVEQFFKLNLMHNFSQSAQFTVICLSCYDLGNQRPWLLNVT